MFYDFNSRHKQLQYIVIIDSGFASWNALSGLELFILVLVLQYSFLLVLVFQPKTLISFSFITKATHSNDLV